MLDIFAQLEIYKAQSKVNPQKENGHIRINNEIFDSLYKIDYAYASTLPIVLFILRKTWGWDKKADKVTQHQIQDNTPYKKMSIIRGLKEAEMRRILIIERQQGKPNKILFNKYYDTWQTSIIHVTSNIDDTSNIKDTTQIEITLKPVTQTIPVTQAIPVTPMLPTSNTGDTGTSNTGDTTPTIDLHSPKTNIKQLLENNIPSKEGGVNPPTNYSFAYFKQILSQNKNKIAVLVEAFKVWHRDAPNEDLEHDVLYGYIGKMAKRLNDSGYLLKIIWDTVTASISGSHLNYINALVSKKIKLASEDNRQKTIRKIKTIDEKIKEEEELFSHGEH